MKDGPVKQMLRSDPPSFDWNAIAVEPIDGAATLPVDGVEANCLFIGQNGKGAWVVRDKLGLKAGIFRSRASAFHFAKEEARACHLQVHEVATRVELGIA
jgi:hypothetical protein